MPGLMKVYDSLSQADQDIVRRISDAARRVFPVNVKPANDDRAAVFDEAVAVFLVESRKGSPVYAPSAQPRDYLLPGVS